MVVGGGVKMGENWRFENPVSIAPILSSEARVERSRFASLSHQSLSFMR